MQLGNLSSQQNQQKRQNVIVVGLCFMQRKIKAKRNQQIYARLNCQEIQTVQLWPYFDQHWTTWPKVDVLLQSHTGNFPYIMLWQYVQKHKPFMINDLQNQQLLWDRTVIYQVLNQISVPVPKYYPMYLNQNHASQLEEKCFGKIIKENGQTVTYQDYIKDSQNTPKLFRQQYDMSKNNFITNQISETSEGLCIHSSTNSFKIHKPFVEKPSNSHDHKISLYYPKSLGGGRRLLFRQNHGHVSSAQSEYQRDEHYIRKDQNYIYQEFIATNVFDIKVYTIGQFIFAESRRSPMVYAQKDLKNTETRNQIELTPEEKQYCRRIVRKFKFPICGFDILRSEGKSYVCDINGWVFAKGGGNSSEEVRHYWDLVAGLLKNMVFEKFYPQNVELERNFKSFKEYKQQLCLEIQSVIPQQNEEELRYVLQMIASKQIEQSQTNLEQSHNALILMGEQIRKHSYDGINSLRLYSTFQHQLKVECSSEQIEKIRAGYLLKGYLGIEGELSPLEVSVLKINHRNSKIPLSQSQILSDSLRKVLANIQQKIVNKDHHQSTIKLKSQITFQPQQVVQQTSKLFKKIEQDNSGVEILEQQNQSAESGQNTTLSRIEFKIYQQNLNHSKEIMSTENDCSKFRLEVQLFYDNKDVVTLKNVSRQKLISAFKSLY